MNAFGRHVLLDLFDCNEEVINSVDAVRTALLEAAKRARGAIVDVVFYELESFGISGSVFMTGCHISVHTRPQARYVAVDIFSSGDVVQPGIPANFLIEQFGAERASRVEMPRGVFPHAATPVSPK